MSQTERGRSDRALVFLVQSVTQTGHNPKTVILHRIWRRCSCTARATHWRTYWNCNGENTASVSVARTLGYRRVHEYRLVAWRPAE